MKALLNDLTCTTAVVALALASCSTSAHCAESSTQYVIVTALGPGLTIIQKRNETGTSVSGVSHETFPFVDATFDAAVQDAAERLVRQAQGGSGPSVVRARVSGMVVDERSYDLNATALAPVIDAVRADIAEPQRARLIVVAALKDSLHFPAEVTGTAIGTHLGEGAAAGLGFYIDRQTAMWDKQGGNPHPGFTAVFANLQLLLVDFDKRSVIARETSTEAELVTMPWEAIPPGQKVTLLRGVLSAKVNLHLPALLRADK
jgi:hypothetical protein